MKVDAARAREIAREKYPAEPRYTQVCMERAIEQAVREQTDWLMEEVCGVCGEVHLLPRTDNHTGYICAGRPTARAEFLRQRGERP